MHLSEVFQYLVSLSVLGSGLAIGLLIIKFLFRQKLNATWHYTIWFVLVLRLLIPFTPTISFSLLNFVPYYQQTINLPTISWGASEGANSLNISQKDENGVNTTLGYWSGNGNPEQPSDVPVKSGINWKLLAIAWIIGLITILIYILMVNGIFLFKIKKLPICNSEDILRILEECKSKLKIHSEVSIVYDDSLKSPALFGFQRPQIIISPEIVEKLSLEQLRYIFLHELSHLKRRDLLVNGLVSAIQAVYWFNPVIWYALRQMKQDCEMACDATALAFLQPEDHKKYGQTIISLLQMLSEPHWAAGTLGFVSKFNKRRIVMIATYKKITVIWAIAVLASLLIVGCSTLNNPGKPNVSTQNQEVTANSGQQTTNNNSPTSSIATPPELNSVVYKNTEYGFSFTLPASWQGYSIIPGKWEGNDVKSGKVTETGPIISIRHPQWTSQNPRQDIPIYVFTISQWNLLQQEAYHIGAAPIGPSELGRNGTYVFALPARYNFAFPTGFEEVEKILENHPLKAS